METRAYISAEEVAALFNGNSIGELEFTTKECVMEDHQLTGYQIVFRDRVSNKIFAFTRLRQPSDGLVCYEVEPKEQTKQVWIPVA